MSHDDLYLTTPLRTDEERRADWSRVEQISPDTAVLMARIVLLEDERVHHLARIHQQGNTINQLRAEKKLRDAA